MTGDNVSFGFSLRHHPICPIHFPHLPTHLRSPHSLLRHQKWSALIPEVVSTNLVCQ